MFLLITFHAFEIYIFCSPLLGDRVVSLLVALVPPGAPAPPAPPAHPLAALVALVPATAGVHLGAASHGAGVHTDPAALVSGLGNTAIIRCQPPGAQWSPDTLQH